MTTLHLLPSTARATARSLQNGQATLAAHLHELSAAARRLDSAWQGGGKETFALEMNALLRRLETLQEELALLAARLEQEVTEWEETDRRGASAWHSLGVPLWSALPFTGGGRVEAAFYGLIPPLFTAVSLTSLLSGLPAWLQALLDRLFPPAETLSPFPQAPPAGVRPGALAEIIRRLGQDQPSATPPASASVPASPAAPSAPPAPQYEIYHPVPLRSQGDLYGSAACLPTALSMVMDYYHARDPALPTASPQDLLNMLDPGDGTSKNGIGFNRLNDDLAELGYRVETRIGNLDDLRQALQDGPVVVNVKVDLLSFPAHDIRPGSGYNHTVVVKGLNADSVVLNDPWSGAEKVFSRADFERMWAEGGNWMNLIRPQ